MVYIDPQGSTNQNAGKSVHFYYYTMQLRSNSVKSPSSDIPCYATDLLPVEQIWTMQSREFQSIGKSFIT